MEDGTITVTATKGPTDDTAKFKVKIIGKDTDAVNTILDSVKLKLDEPLKSSITVDEEQLSTSGGKTRRHRTRYGTRHGTRYGTRHGKNRRSAASRKHRKT